METIDPYRTFKQASIILGLSGGRLMPLDVLRITRVWLVWTIVSFPISPSVYALIWHGDRCFGPLPPELWKSPLACLVSAAALAPFAAVFGGLAKDDAPPPNMWPGILLTACVLGAVAVAVQVALKRKT